MAKAMNGGWIRVWRELLQKPIWKQSTPPQKSVLITLLLMANYEPNTWEWKGETFTVKEGEFVTSLESIRKMAGNGISIQNVRSSLKRFKNLQFLTYKPTKMGRLISIMNWSGYQPEQQGGQHRTQQRGNKGATTKKKDKKERSKNYGDFETFWKAYPLRKGKEYAFKCWQKVTDRPPTETILKAIENQKTEKVRLKAENKFCPEWCNPSTWINQARWEDETEKPEEDADVTRHNICKNCQKPKNSLIDGLCSQCREELGL